MVACQAIDPSSILGQRMFLLSQWLLFLSSRLLHLIAALLVCACACGCLAWLPAVQCSLAFFACGLLALPRHPVHPQMLARSFARRCAVLHERVWHALELTLRQTHRDRNRARRGAKQRCSSCTTRAGDSLARALQCSVCSAVDDTQNTHTHTHTHTRTHAHTRTVEITRGLKTMRRMRTMRTRKRMGAMREMAGQRARPWHWLRSQQLVRLDE